MHKRHMFIALAFAATLMLAAAVDAQEPAPLPKAQEIRDMVDAGKYRDALKPLFRVLSLKGSAAMGFDRYEMLMLRAECQLQIKDQSACLQSLEMARQEAFATNRPDRAAMPRALAFLIQHSNAYRYQSKSGSGTKPIPILDRTLRPAAFAALLVDELPAAKRKVQSVNNARALAQVLEAGKEAGTVRALEIVSASDQPDKPAETMDAGEGTAPQTAPLTGLVTSNADRLIKPALDDLEKTTDRIKAAANAIVNKPVEHYDAASKRGWVEQVRQRQGPSDQDVQTLHAIAGTCDKLRSTAVELAKAVGTDFDTYKAIVKKADALQQKVAAVLHDDYTVIPGSG